MLIIRNWNLINTQSWTSLFVKPAVFGFNVAKQHGISNMWAVSILKTGLFETIIM